MPATSEEPPLAHGWHALEIREVAGSLGTDETSGLDAGEVTRRVELHGPNLVTAKSGAPPSPPSWRWNLRNGCDSEGNAGKGKSWSEAR
jgi:hypothetical protein